MRKKFLYGALVLSMAGMMMTGCGSKETTEKETTQSITEVVGDAQDAVDNTNPEDVVGGINDVLDDATTEEDFIEKSIDDVTKACVVDNKVELVLNEENDRIWSVMDADTESVQLDMVEDEMGLKYVITPLKSGQTTLMFVGENSIDRANLYLTVIVADDMSVEILKEGVVVDIGNEVVDDDINSELNSNLSSISDTYIQAFGENAPSPLDTRNVDISSTDDMMYVVGTESLPGLKEAIVSEPMMSSIAFSLVVMEFDNNANAEAAADTIKDTAPVDKWLCVQPEAVGVKVVDDVYVVFTMTSEVNLQTFEGLE